jgi:chromosome segregation ATPase
VLYVTPKAENYDGEPVSQGLPDPFVDSLTHSSIIVQIPLLHGRLRNHLERILNIFDQTRKDTAQGYLLNIDEADYSGDEDQRLIFHRLLTAGASKEMRERMEMEELLFRDYDERGVELLKQRKRLQENEKKLQENEKLLQENEKQLQEQSEQLQEKDSQLQEKDSQLQEKDSQLQEKDSQLQEKDSQLQAKDSQLQEQGEQLRQTIRLLMQASVSPDLIAERLNMSIEAVKRMAED